MTDEKLKEYMDNQFARVLTFYDVRSVMYKRWYRILSVYVIVVSAILAPFVAFAPAGLGWRIASAVISASIVIATSLLSQFKCHENWLSYRASWDALNREQRYHSAEIQDYKASQDKNALFVERVEAILTREGAEFYARHLKCDEQSKAAGKKK